MSRDLWLGWGDAIAGQGPGWGGPFARGNAGSSDNSSSTVFLSFEGGLLPEDEITYTVVFTPADASPEVTNTWVKDYGGATFYGFVLRNGEEWDSPIREGVYKITAKVSGTDCQNALSLTVLGPGVNAGYASMSWHGDDSGSGGGDTGERHLGWGTPEWNDYPSSLPLSADNAGSMEDYGGSWYYGIVPDGNIPPGVSAVEMLYTFYPADGGEVRTHIEPYASSTSNPIDYFRAPNWWDHPGAGVLEVELFVDGVRGPNKLVMTVTMAENGYGQLSYYAEAVGSPPAFWTAFQGARETP